MARHLTIPKDNIPSIALIAEHSDSLHLIEDVAKNLDPAKCTMAAVTQSFSAKANIPVGLAHHIVSQVLSFLHLGEYFSMSPSDLFASLTQSLDGNPEAVGIVDLDKWKKADKSIIGVLNRDSILYIIEKTARLAYSHPNPIHDISVITDLRPTFDEGGIAIRQMVITHSLELEYNDGNRRQTLYLTLDAADVAKLRKACERAETKSIAIKKQMSSMPYSIVVWGEYQDE